jgi:cell division protein ZapA (FtsZ GTPase activity inhibitor)
MIKGALSDAIVILSSLNVLLELTHNMEHTLKLEINMTETLMTKCCELM